MALTTKSWVFETIIQCISNMTSYAVYEARALVNTRNEYKYASGATPPHSGSSDTAAPATNVPWPGI